MQPEMAAKRREASGWLAVGRRTARVAPPPSFLHPVFRFDMSGADGSKQSEPAKRGTLTAPMPSQSAPWECHSLLITLLPPRNPSRPAKEVKPPSQKPQMTNLCTLSAFSARTVDKKGLPAGSLHAVEASTHAQDEAWPRQHPHKLSSRHHSPETANREYTMA